MSVPKLTIKIWLLYLGLLLDKRGKYMKSLLGFVFSVFSSRRMKKYFIKKIMKKYKSKSYDAKEINDNEYTKETLVSHFKGFDKRQLQNILIELKWGMGKSTDYSTVKLALPIIINIFLTMFLFVGSNGLNLIQSAMGMGMNSIVSKYSSSVRMKDYKNIVNGMSKNYIFDTHQMFYVGFWLIVLLIFIMMMIVLFELYDNYIEKINMITYEVINELVLENKTEKNSLKHKV